jgi:hypothetical protein
VCALRAREEVYQVNNTFFVDVAGLQDIRGREVLLLGGVRFLSWRTYAEVTAFVLIEQTAEY